MSVILSEAALSIIVSSVVEGPAVALVLQLPHGRPELQPLSYSFVIVNMDKQHILDEIRRTTAANGGSPLGKKRFFDETGIKESDWSGKFWPRWSAAVFEAGFTPLTLQGPHDRNPALAKVIALTRRLRDFQRSQK